MNIPRMKSETPHQTRMRILRQLSEVELPKYVTDDTSSAEMAVIDDMIRDKWLGGHSLRHSSGFGFATIQVIQILDKGKQALDGTTGVEHVAVETHSMIVLGDYVR